MAEVQKVDHNARTYPAPYVHVECPENWVAINIYLGIPWELGDKLIRLKMLLKPHELSTQIIYRHSVTPLLLGPHTGIHQAVSQFIRQGLLVKQAVNGCAYGFQGCREEWGNDVAVMEIACVCWLVEWEMRWMRSVQPQSLNPWRLADGGVLVIVPDCPQY